MLMLFFIYIYIYIYIYSWNIWISIIIITNANIINRKITHNTYTPVLLVITAVKPFKILPKHKRYDFILESCFLNRELFTIQKFASILMQTWPNFLLWYIKC